MAFVTIWAAQGWGKISLGRLMRRRGFRHDRHHASTRMTLILMLADNGEAPSVTGCHAHTMAHVCAAGEEPAAGIVAGITTNPGGATLVTCVEDERLEFQDGMPGCVAQGVPSSCGGRRAGGAHACGRMDQCRSAELACACEQACEAAEQVGRGSDGGVWDVKVTFGEVIGMEELNDGKPRKVKNCKVRRPCPGAAAALRSMWLW